MQELTVSLNLPRDLLGVLDVAETSLENRLREIIALELFREGLISSGKGGELLGKTKWDFIQLLARHNIPYFNETPEELVTEVANLEQLLGEKKK
jgi:predicted HTH domain antitoxin